MSSRSASSPALRQLMKHLGTGTGTPGQGLSLVETDPRTPLGRDGAMQSLRALPPLVLTFCRLRFTRGKKGHRTSRQKTNAGRSPEVKRKKRLALSLFRPFPLQVLRIPFFGPRLVFPRALPSSTMGFFLCQRRLISSELSIFLLSASRI